jgi:hypothetical protein
VLSRVEERKASSQIPASTISVTHALRSCSRRAFTPSSFKGSLDTPQPYSVGLLLADHAEHGTL